MQRKIVFWLLTTVLLNPAPPAHAQQPKKVPRIGYQSAGSSGEPHEAFRQGMRELGYVEGQNLIIEWRFAEGKPDQVPRNTAELLRLKMDVIVTGGSTDTRAAKAATNTIPLVMAHDTDPVRSGIVARVLPGLAAISPG